MEMISEKCVPKIFGFSALLGLSHDNGRIGPHGVHILCSPYLFGGYNAQYQCLTRKASIVMAVSILGCL